MRMTQKEDHAVIIYVYETIPTDPEKEPEYYEVKKNITDEPLAVHPETGEPIRRVILGGLGVLYPKGGRDTGSGICGPGCCG